MRDGMPRRGAQNKWLLAGLAGFLAALTRAPGVWLVVPMGVEWFSNRWAQNRNVWVQSGGSLLLVPLGLGVYMLYLFQRFGDPWLWIHALDSWQNRFILPWESIFLTVHQIIFGDPSAWLNNFLDLGTTVFVLAMLGLGLLPNDWRTLSRRGWQPRLPLLYSVYGLLFTLVPLTLTQQGGLAVLPMVNAARHTIVVFPAFMMAGTVLQGRLRAPLFIGLSFGLQCIFVYTFVRWLWVD